MRNKTRAKRPPANVMQFRGHGLWWHFERRGWDGTLTAARAHFWCRICKSRFRQRVRPVRLELVPRREGDLELPWPDERRWKRAVARLR